MLKAFTKTVSIYGLAPAFSKFVGFFLIPVYTRVFCPEEYGVIDLFNTVIYLFTVCINLQIYSAVGRYFKESKNRKLLVSTALWNEIFLSLIVVSILVLFSADINMFLFGNISYNTVFILALLWIPFNVLSTYLTVVMRFEDKPLIFIRIAILQTFIKVAVSLFTILVLDFGIAGIFIGHIAGDLTAFSLFLFFLRKYVGIQVDLLVLKKLLLFSLPLVPATFALFGSDLLSRIILLKYLSLHSVGLFAVAIKVASAFGILMMALRMAWEPFIFSNLQRVDHKKQFVRIYKMIAILLCLMVCAITLFSKEILFIITTKEYFAAVSLIGILSINFVFKILRELVGIGPKIVHKTIYDSISQVLGVVVSVLAMVILIPSFGVMGAALALCLGSGTSLVLGWYYSEKFYPIGFPKTITLSVIVVMSLAVVLNNSFAVAATLKFGVVLLIFLILLYHRDRIRSVIDS